MNRSKNFVETKKKILLELIDRYKSVIECKRTDAKSTKEKEDAWKKLCDDFNSESTYMLRTVNNLKSAWKNLKTRAKADSAFVRRERLKTGGGPPVNLHEVTELVQSKHFFITFFI